MLGKGKRRIHIHRICLHIIILLIINISILVFNFFANHSVVTKESIVGVNPVVATKSIMTYHAPLTVVLENEKKKEIEMQPKTLEEKENNAEEYQEVQICKEDQELEQKKELFYEIEREDIVLEQPVETYQEETQEEIQTDTIQKQEMQSDLVTVKPYQDFSTIGKIEIPATQLEIPIFSQVTLEGMKKAPCLLYSTGELNQSGNHLIVGHNFRNGTIFSNNKNLKLGDKIYITTLDENKVEYTIYRKFITTAEDVSYIKRDTYDKPEITLSSCTDDDKDRIIILARVES